jgi:hypothetical protein
LFEGISVTLFLTVGKTIAVSIYVRYITAADTGVLCLVRVVGTSIIAVLNIITVTVIISSTAITAPGSSLVGIKGALVITVGSTVTVRVSFSNATTTDARGSRLGTVGGTYIMAIVHLITVSIDINKGTTTDTGSYLG